MKRLFTAFLLVSLLSGCIEKELTPEELAFVSGLKSELTSIKAAINDAESQNELYSGGLIKGLIAIRLEVLKTNEALIQQRIHAVESRAPVNISTLAVRPDQALAEKISQDIKIAKEDLAAAEAEAARYSGGLVAAMSASTVATQQNTIAMLQQRYLSAKYGLSLPEITDQSAKPSTQGSAAPSAPSSSTTVAAAPAAKLAAPRQGPFGLAKGVSVAEVEAMIGSSLRGVEGRENLYRASSAPNSSSDFDSFILMISPTVGLCQLRAIGKDITSNSFGLQVKSAFNDLQASLTAVYGEPTEKTDLLLPGSIWKSSEDWMMGLYKKERYLMSDWKSTKAAPMANNLEFVGLEARAATRSSAFLYLQYDFDNLSLCREEIEAAKQKSL